MFPILLRLGPLTLPTYGVLMATAFLVALQVARRHAGQDGIDPESLTGLFVVILICGIGGAKLTLYLVDWRYYLAHPDAILASWRSAGVYYGGFLGAGLASVWYVRRHRLPLGPAADAIAPSVALAQSIGRLGCFAAGCCYGLPTHVPWAVTFTDPEAAAITGVPLGIPRHPTQIYLSLNALALFGLLLLVRRWKRRRELPSGVVFWSYVLLYSCGRFALEFLRADPRGTLGPLSTSQGIAIVGAAVAICALARLALAHRRTVARA
jgi:phosphatidylglycerol:prolipoprotein diacylglycerol transferase